MIDGQLEVWFVEPAGMVDVHKGGYFAAEQARFLTGDASAVLERLARERKERATFVHVWSTVTSYDPFTRKSIIDWGLRWGRDRVEHIWVVLGPKTPAMVRMACQLGSMAMNVAGIRITVSDDIGDVKAPLIRAAL